jgi:DNA-binding transcriptional regulator YiaG
MCECVRHMSVNLEKILTKARMRALLPAPAICKLIREQSNLTQDDIAEAVGVDRASISRWESGDQSPRGAARETYAALLSRLQSEVLAS